jgi:hypothetical protein
VGRRECTEKYPEQKDEKEVFNGWPPGHPISLAFLRLDSRNPRYNGEVTATIRRKNDSGSSGAAIIGAMGTGVFTALAVVLFTASTTAQSVPLTIPRADHVVVFKHERKLELLSHGRVTKIYKVALGGAPVGPKTRQGDHKTPEGVYVLDFRNTHSQFYKSIHISYPAESDRAVAAQKGVSPGGSVFIHGLPNGYGAIGAAHRLKDWTDGCIAVTNEEIDDIGKAVPNGTPIEIRP